MLGLLPADLRRLARDELLVWMPAVPLAMALAALLCAGLGTLASPSAGYLLGFLPFAAIAGTLAYLFTRNTRSVGATFLMALLANFCGFVVLTACGIAGMMVNAHMTFDAAFSAAMVFVPWDLVKSTIAVLVGLSVRRAFPSLASTQR